MSQQEDIRFRLLRMLQDNPNLSQRELAEALGISLGKANYCLRSLLGKGMIKIQNFKNSRQKLAYAYFLTPAGMAEKTALAARFLSRKMDEYERLKAEIESLKTELKQTTQNNRNLPKNL
ncbi:MarR family EPS-associated transcriptional regulator [Noviherbaspirillum aridicola]|uniref:MarR family EPS-associated transcriptional regulator n=1 Tax=Noviherbaspirillum aridicola TaxID=2849687 RepID=A0ABQ4Q2B8_9BURK|nr:MarR family EPS-associated transcriptional regulator [Noviherbaspirillum aridicola]GIZ51284.1 MarR family EPS-associated transcriptional regulator [Noviherbaspirillum aridicola]